MDDGFYGAIISVGPETDQVLVYYGIDDDIIPHLHVLSQTIKSSHWKFKLCNPQYNLTTAQAVDIAQAMMNDFMRKPGIRFQKVMLDKFDLCILSAHRYQQSYRMTALFLLSVLVFLIYTLFLNQFFFVGWHGFPYLPKLNFSCPAEI
jgi:hypothetical protein